MCQYHQSSILDTWYLCVISMVSLGTQSGIFGYTVWYLWVYSLVSLGTQFGIHNCSMYYAIWYPGYQI